MCIKGVEVKHHVLYISVLDTVERLSYLISRFTDVENTLE
jgi:hypothetical protein